MQKTALHHHVQRLAKPQRVIVPERVEKDRHRNNEEYNEPVVLLIEDDDPEGREHANRPNEWVASFNDAHDSEQTLLQ